MKSNREIRIALADLSYLSKDDYVHPVPLNIGYLSAYLKQNLNDVKIEIFKDPQKLYDALAKAPESYTCLALSNYDWNFNLNRHFISMIKLLNPDVITVMGGPNIDADTDAGLKEFFNYFNWLDFYVIGEGEYKFTRLMESIVNNDMKIAKVWGTIPKTIVGFDGKKGTILRGRGDDLGLCDCHTLPSPYLTGLLDEFLADPHLVPIIETNRGCPYSCAYCCWGNSLNSKIRQFDQKTVLEELHYISLRTKNPKKALYIADSNFGILKRDLEIAQAIMGINAKDGSFNNIYVYFAKNTDENAIKIAEILKDVTDISMSKQTLNPEVLKIIGRENIDDAVYDRFYAKLREHGVSTFCELIYGLPGETMESFFNGVEEMYQKDINVVLYPLLLIKGSKINSSEFREAYHIKSAFRIMPRYSGSYGDINSVEYEELLVSHAKLSQDDFCKIRLFLFFHVLFYERIFLELVLFLREKHLNLASFFRFIIDDRLNWPPIFEDFVIGFETDAKEELIEKDNLKFNFTSEELEETLGKAVDLNVYHFIKLIASKERMSCFREYLFEVLKRYFLAKSIAVATEEINSILDICFDQIPDFPEIKKRKTRYYPYDLASWIKNGGVGGLASFKTERKIEYIFELDKGAITEIRTQYEKLNNLELSLYHTRRQMITQQKSPANAYTYQRTQH